MNESREYSYTGKHDVKSTIRMTRSTDPKQIRVSISSHQGDKLLAGDTIWVPEDELKTLIKEV